MNFYTLYEKLRLKERRLLALKKLLSLFLGECLHKIIETNMYKKLFSRMVAMYIKNLIIKNIYRSIKNYMKKH